MPCYTGNSTPLALENSEADTMKALFTVYGACVVVGVHYGVGKHVVDIIPPTNIPICLKVLHEPEELF